MDQSYWVFEFIKVLLAYTFVMYLWPSVVFRRHLSKKSRTYRFCFCVNISILLINTGVIFLGLVHLLNRPLVIILYWAVFLVQLVRNYDLGLSRLKDIRKVLNRTMSVKRMLLNWHSFNAAKLKSAASVWWKSTKGRRLEYFVLCVIVIFATAYFSVNALQLHSYGFGDQYVHHEWIYGLSQGKIFVNGIYPAGMHCFGYLMGTVFPINFYSIILYLGGIHINVYIISVYILSRKLFGWRMSGMLALVGFLTVEQLVINGIFGISRLSWTLPQEFALYAVFMSAFALIGFLRQPPKPRGERFRFFRLSSWRRFLSDRYLFVFISCIAASICVHFYATIISIFVCAVIALVYLPRFFRHGVFIRLGAGALIGLFIAAAPMIGAYIEGCPLQGSLYWAMSVTEGTENQYNSGTTSDATAESTPPAATVDSEKSSEQDTPLLEKVNNRANKVIRGTFLELYGNKRGWLLLNADIAITGISVVLMIITGIIGLIRKRKNKSRTAMLFKAPEGYLITALSAFVLLMAYNPKLMGLPQLVAGARVCSTIDMFSMLLYACFFDILFCLLRPILKERFLKPLSVLACAGIYIYAQAAGIFHGYLYYELTRYPVAVELTKEIVANMPKYQYTIISTTDELYQVIDGGFHEEWIDLLEKQSDKSYTTPTPYLFFFIEKHPILYAQNNFAAGPEWLATEKYSQYYGKTGSQYPDILHGQISDDSVEMTISYKNKRSTSASDLDNRIILESKAYAWYQKFSKMHPNDGEVIYEDEDFLCYCVHQNEFSLFSLGIMEDEPERNTH